MPNTTTVTSFVRKRPSPAMMVALFVSLTGNGLALSGKFTVDGNDLEPGAVHRYAIRGGSVSSAKLAGGAVHASDFGTIVTVSKSVSVPNADQNQVGAFCPEGAKRLSGGTASSTFGTPISGSRPQPHGWDGWLRNDSGAPVTLTVYAVCLK
jgi:hypothetical protein